MTFDKKYLVFSLVSIVIGMGIGIYMAASHDHRLFVAHAHILLVGFVVSFIYATIHKLWLIQPGRIVASVQFWLHLIASVVVGTGLVLLYGGVFSEPTLEPILAPGSVCLLVAGLLMFYMVLKFGGLTRGAT